MNFRTIVEITKPGFEISHSTKCVFSGSCFTENIGNKLNELKIPAVVNPTGILYNPASIAKSVKMALETVKINDSDILYANELYNNFNFHSDFSAKDKRVAIDKMNLAIEYFGRELKNAELFFVTFGTSFVYKVADNGEIVSNCHKLPATIFSREFMPVMEIVLLWKMTIEKLKSVNPNIKIIFTVSPIRHLKDGAVGNMQSKAALILAVKEIVESNDDAYYFPAYEIVNDELRDYRFYAHDMLHPSETTTNYIMERFSDTYFSERTKEINRKIEKIVIASKHRVFNLESAEYLKFCKSIVDKIEEIKTILPNIDFSKEEAVFKIK